MEQGSHRGNLDIKSNRLPAIDNKNDATCGSKQEMPESERAALLDKLRLEVKSRDYSKRTYEG